jgi:ribonuclease HIII
MTSFTRPLSISQAEALRELLHQRGFTFTDRPHTLFAAAKDKLQISVYTKGPKVLVQGKEAAHFVEFTLEPEILGRAELGYEEVNHPDWFSPHIGIDESGKGDVFGPLTIAAVATTPDATRTLLKLGVADSKRISSDRRIRELAAAIRQAPDLHHELLSLGPESYNRLYTQFHNLNRLLAWGHAQVLEKLLAKVPTCPRALSDQFARPDLLRRALGPRGRAITLEQRPRAESDPAVAAASILARERFIDWIDTCSTRIGFGIPKGAGPAVRPAAEAAFALHPSSLHRLVKAHFSTVKDLFDTPGEPSP